METTNKQSNSTLNASIQLTLKHFKKILAYSFGVAVVYVALALAYQFIKTDEGSPLSTLMMAGWLLWIPMLCGFCHFLHHLFIDKPSSVPHSFVDGFKKVIPIFGTLVGLTLLPSLVMGSLAALGFWLIHIGHEFLFWPLIALGGILSLLFINRNLFSIIIVSTSNVDSMQAFARTHQAIKNAYWKTMFTSTLVFFVLLATFSAPLWLGWLIPLDMKLRLFAIIGVSLEILCVSPFLWAYMILDLQNLEQHNLQKPDQPKQPKQKIESVKKSEMKEGDWF